MTAEEYEALKESISKQGVLQRILVHQGKIIDGRHRYQACRELGIECPSDEWNGRGSLIETVVSRNSHRRNLTTGQRAVVAVKILPMLEAEAKKRMKAGGGDKKSGKERIPDPILNPGQARDHAARLVGVNPRYVSDAKTIEQAAPDRLEDIAAGRATIPEVKRELPPKPRAVSRGGSTSKSGRPEIRPLPWREFIAEIDDGSVDLILTTPPTSASDSEGDRPDEWIPKILPKLKSTGRAFILTRPDLAEMSAYHQALLAWCKEAGFTLGDTLMWVFDNTVGNPPPHDYLVNWRPIFHLRGPDASPLDRSKTKAQRAVFRVQAPYGKPDGPHPSEMSEDLARRLILQSTKPEDLVVDPFAGKGVFLLVATGVGRKALGAETDPYNLRVCRERSCQVKDTGKSG
jgi:DNA modification methylase